MLRSFLFVPAHRPDRFDKALQSGAHAVVVDLEDAVAPVSKDCGRAALRNWSAAGRTVWVRINGVETAWFEDDLPLLDLPHVAGAMLPKAEDDRAVQEVLRHAGSRPVVALVESARGLKRIDPIAAAGVTRIAFGSVDFQLDLGLGGGRDELLVARTNIVMASRLAGLAPPIDGVTLGLNDEATLAEDVAYARRMGFGGKLCIHPNQVQTVNAGFQPSPHEIDEARRILAAAEASGQSATRVDGKLVDGPVIERARALLDGARDLPTAPPAASLA